MLNRQVNQTDQHEPHELQEQLTVQYDLYTQAGLQAGAQPEGVLYDTLRPPQR